MLYFLNGKSLTYKELDDKANALANFLKTEKHVKPQDTIGLLFDKSFEEIISMLATLKLGAIYVPIDISYPKDRIKYMIEDAKAKFILTTSSVDKSLVPNENLSIFVDLGLPLYDNTLPFDTFKSAQIICLIYTSGSTGRPKGVMIGNSGIVRLVRNTNHVEFSRGNRVLHAASIAFDVCSFEVWGALLNGLELFLIRKNDLLNLEYFEKFLKDNNITIMLSTTAFVNKICETNPNMFSGLKYLVSGGEAASLKHIKLAKKANPDLIFNNAYGPTENTVVSTYFQVKDLKKDLKDFVPIGRPISNTTCYILSIDRTSFTTLCYW